MIFPNKFIKYEESTIFKMLSVLEICQNNVEIGILELYHMTEKKFDGIDEFLYSIDILHILETIKVDFNNEIISYAQKD